MAIEKADLVIIGAGLYGIQIARTYIQLHPSQHVVLLDAGDSLGGTWSKERVYSGLKTNNVLGWFEFPDMPILPGEFDVQPGQHIKSKVVNQYLEAYAKRFHVFERIRLRTKVNSIEHAEKEGWFINWTKREGSSESISENGTIHTSKLVLATGHTNEALLPRFQGQETFQKPFFHTKDWAQHQDLLKTANEAVILGGGKSAYDAAYMCADAGIKVHMIMRASGHGPAWMSTNKATPLNLDLESLPTRRIVGLFSPCIFADYSPYGLIRRFLHQTWLGQQLTRAFWKLVENDTLQTSGILGHPGSEKLMPWSPFFWSGTSCSILNHDKDFYCFVRDGTVEVHIADVKQLANGDAVVLSTGETLRTDAIVCATSWKDRPTLNFLPSGSDAKLGLPHYSGDPGFGGRFARADEEIFARVPLLRDQPVINRNMAKLPTAQDEPFDPTRCNMPYLLYRFMVPPAYLHERSIAFAGVPLSFNQGQMAPAEALWISAYFDGKVEVPETEEEAMDETVLHARYAQWRNPAGYGARFPDWIFETLPWLDMVYNDIGVNRWRKKGLADLFSPYMPVAFAGVWDEYQWKYPSATGR
ncbi:uncharacterized protein BCR38DRAFT_462539 [Pseudomassariella vexata]|uniref:FAD/NAD(P)-binding domain-containing protein n=1 Tax=Pseudomassariella vexata TaxID=1141098 RepID=A0A1Y2EID2_9PEZI|nr:uncharacterized protein BCR38DRAFT_462539 [Pseudomassariella vexata]ORY71341.1 hypothetical protein BCR38DRAFT_462539 [Pseudomassariella vexata]